jgi:apolipoprotein N-acyltransferase
VRQPRRADVAVAAAAGAATTLAFPTTGWWPFAILGPAILLGILRGQQRGRATRLAAIWGFGYFGTLLSWVAAVDALGWAVLTITEAGFVGVFGYIAGSTAWASSVRTPRARTLLGLALVWTGLEILRARFPVGGFAWGGIGYPFVDVPGVRDLAAIGGVHAISAWVLVVAAFVVRSGERTGPWRDGLRRRAVGLALLFGVVGLASLAPRPAASGTLDVAIVQGNVPKERFATAAGRRGRVGPEDIEVVENHLEVTEELLDDGDRPDVVIWPENAFDRDPDDFTELASRTQALIDALGVPFIVGAIVDDPDGRSFNSNLLWEPRVGITARYDKRHLVPFGEYVPWGWPRDLIPALREQVPTDLSPGAGSSILVVDGVRIGNVICFESADPREVRRAAAGGVAQVLLVSTNDATFGDSPAAAQHLLASRMRAIEHRRTMLQAAISGISAIIDADGDATQRTTLFQPAIVRGTVPLVDGRTIYGFAGGALESGAALLTLLALGFTLLPGRVHRDPVQGTRPRIGRIVVAIPTYDEAETIEETVAGVRAHLPRAEIWILDDASPDGTGAIADRLAAADPAITVIHRTEKRGLGHAYLDAFARAIADPNIDAVIEIDADGSHPPDALPAILERAEDADVVIGSRYVPGGRVEGWSRGRELLSRAGNAYAWLWLGVPARDLTAGYRLYRRQILELIPLERVGSEGYAFQVEMTLRAARVGATIAEVPITFRERRAGASKMSRRIVLEALWRIPILALRPGGRQGIDRRRANRRR